MPKYLFEVKYTPAGAAGLMKDGGTKRRAAAAALVESLGGSMETNLTVGSPAFRIECATAADLPRAY